MKVVHVRRTGRGRRARSGGRRALGQTAVARCGAKAAGAPARWQGGGASLAVAEL